jgi:hypothetical protein
MKILLVNPQIDAQHGVVQLLKARGMAVLLPTSSAKSGAAYFDEAWQIIQTHGASLDLVVVHREGAKGKDSGIELVFKIKKDPVQHDLPILLTTDSWSEEECANHQQTPMGANAYLKWPTEDEKLVETIDAILPPEEGQRTSSSIQALSKVSTPASTASGDGGSDFVLEDPSEIFSKAKPGIEISKSGISLSNDEPIEFTTPRISLPTGTPPAAPADATNIALATPELEVSIQVSSAISLSSDTSASLPQASIRENLTGMSGMSLQLEATSSSAGGVSLDPPPIDLGAKPPEPTFAAVEPLEPSVSSAPSFREAPAESSNADLGSSVESQMPYLFSKGKTGQNQVNAAVVSTFAHPLGDAIVPGGASTSPDVETLKKYLLLREQDVAALSVQLKNAKDETVSLSHLLMTENSHVEELEMIVNEQKRKINDFEKEKAIALETLNSEIAEIRFQSKAKNDKAKLLEMQVNEASTEIDRLKERVRSDIRKIRVRERELENKLEITKKDSEVVLAARENKITELKRKIDLLEFNMDLLQDRYSREKDAGFKLREKLAKAAQVVRVAEGLLDDPQAGSLKQTVESLTADSLVSSASRGDKAS